jgi:hypothetical protein
MERQQQNFQTVVTSLARMRARVYWPLAIVVVLGLLLLWQTAGALVPVTPRPDGGVSIFQPIAAIAGWLFTIACIGVAVMGGLQLIGWLARNFGDLFSIKMDDIPAPKEEPKPPAKEMNALVIADAGSISNNLNQMQRRIEVLNARRANAAVELDTVNEQARLLVRFVQSIAAKMAWEMKELTRLDALDDAIRSGDNGKVKRHAAAIQDSHIRALVTDPNRSMFQEKLLELIDSEAGSLEAELDTYQTWINNWIEQLTDFRATMNQLSVTIEASEALPILVEAQERLTLAADALGIDQKKLQELMAARSIPRLVMEPRAMARESVHLIEGEVRGGTQ